MTLLSPVWCEVKNIPLCSIKLTNSPKPTIAQQGVLILNKDTSNSRDSKSWLQTGDSCICEPRKNHEVVQTWVISKKELQSCAY